MKPPLQSGTQAATLLRKPRLPTLIQPPPLSPPPVQHDAQAIIDLADQSSTTTRILDAKYADNMREFTYVAGASPPPPSEFSVHYKTPVSMSPPPLEKKSVKQTDDRYIIDSIHRQNTNLGTYVEGQSLVKPYQSRGPAPLPAREPLRRIDTINKVAVAIDTQGHERYTQAQMPLFSLEDFIQKIAEKERVSVVKVEQIVYSRHNYKKMQELLMQFLQQERGVTEQRVSTVNLQLPDDMRKNSARVPHMQLVYEMAALIKQQMSSVIQTDLRPVIKSLPKYSPNYKTGEARPHTEIVLYEQGGKRTDATQISIKLQPDVTQFSTRESLFHSATARYFQGSMRSNSPFTVNDDSMISPSELAILDSLMNGGVALSLKAHFIDELPDIEPLTRSLTYINLSFNDFKAIPVEIYDLFQLQTLKLRNNPIRDLPPEIARLKQLRTLVLSFCLLTSLPMALYRLKKLVHLDVAYNKILFVSDEIKYNKSLRELNLEGNQLVALPTGMLRMQSLRHLCVRNNFLHPLFWKDNSKNTPQRLSDIACQVFKSFDMETLYPSLPDKVKQLVKDCSVCDCCGGARYGQGLRTIRPVSKIFGVRNLPIMFHCCSSYCYHNFINNTDLMEQLYGTS